MKRKEKPPIPGLGTLRTFDLSTFTLQDHFKKKVRKAKAKEKLMKRKNRNGGEGGGAAAHPSEGRRGSVDGVVFEGEEQHTKGELDDLDDALRLGDALRRIHQLAPGDETGKWFLKNMLSQVYRSADKDAVCSEVVAMLQQWHEDVEHKHEMRKLKCDRKCIFTKEANDTRMMTGLTTELSKSSFLQQAVEEVYYKTMLKTESPAVQAKRKAKEKQQKVKQHGRKDDNHDGLPYDPNSLVEAMRQRSDTGAKTVSTVDDTKAHIEAAELKAKPLKRAKNFVPANLANASKGLRIELPEIASRYGEGFSESWEASSVEMKLSKPRRKSMELMSMSRVEFQREQDRLEDAALRVMTSSTSLGSLSTSSLTDGSAEDSVNDMSTLGADADDSISAFSMVLEPGTSASVVGFKSAKARKVHKQTQRLLTAMSAPSHMVMARRNKRSICRSIYHAKSESSIAAEHWKHKVSLDGIQQRREVKAADLFGRLREVFESINPPYKLRIETEILLHDAFTRQAASQSPAEEGDEVDGRPWTTYDIVKAWEQWGDGVIARQLLMRCLDYAQKYRPSAEAASADSLPESVLQILIVTDTFRPPLPQMVLVEWIEKLVHSVEDHILGAREVLSGRCGLASGKEYFDETCKFQGVGPQE
ncbi:unnamed protein product [Chrysoparadoxa australica]